MQPAQGKFTDHKGMSQDKTRVEQFRERMIADPQMVDPDGVSARITPALAAVAAF
jgi:hypothetical protein